VFLRRVGLCPKYTALQNSHSLYLCSQELPGEISRLFIAVESSRLIEKASILYSSLLLSKNIKIRIYETKILPVVLYGCKTWSLALREEHRLRVFEKRVLRRIFEWKREIK
jgi:hypothetical protein